MRFPCVYDRGPAVANEHERTFAENAGRELVPDERDLRHGSHSAFEGNKADGSCDEILQPFVTVVGGDLVSQETVRLVFELIHHDPEHASADLVRSARRGLHYAEVSASANGE